MAKDLTAAEIAELTDHPNTEGWQDGLYRVAPNLYIQIRGDSSTWMLRYTHQARLRIMGLGPTRLTTTTQAKRLSIKYMAVLQNGGDPFEARDADRGRTRRSRSTAKTFREAARAYIAEREPHWKSPTHYAQWAQSLRDYA